MNVVIGEDQARQLSERYLMLPLDQFVLQGRNDVIRSYCVISDIPLSELSQADHWHALHVKLMENYGNKNWNFCQQALEHLIGKWNGEVDTFYLDLQNRINQYQAAGVSADWSPIIERPA